MFLSKVRKFNYTISSPCNFKRRASCCAPSEAYVPRGFSPESSLIGQYFPLRLPVSPALGSYFSEGCSPATQGPRSFCSVPFPWHPFASSSITSSSCSNLKELDLSPTPYQLKKNFFFFLVMLGLCCGAQASHCSSFFCRAQALGLTGFRCLQHVISRLGIKPMSSALANECLFTSSPVLGCFFFFLKRSFP